MRSAKLATHTVRSRIVIAMVGASSGKVMLRKRRHGPAPSIDAASYRSRGIDCRAASRVMAKNGIPHQTLATMGPQSACRGSDKRLSGAFINPQLTNQCGRGPTSGLNSQAQLSADKKLGTAQGRKTSNCTSL